MLKKKNLCSVVVGNNVHYYEGTMVDKPYNTNYITIKTLDEKGQIIYLNFHQWKDKSIKFKIQGCKNVESTMLNQFKIPIFNYWKHFWRKKISKKKLEVIYFIILNATPTKNKLKHYMDIDSKCYCGQEETVTHLFEECEIVDKFWNYLQEIWWEKEEKIINSRMKLTGHYSRKNKERWSCFHAEAIMTIWKARNNFIFNNEPFNDTIMMNMFKKNYKC